MTRYTLYPTALVAAILSLDVVAAQYTATYDPAHLPPTTEQQQSGTNQCGTGNNQTSLCQNVYVNSVQDFCVWGPPNPNGVIGEVEQISVAYCSISGRGTRLIPEGALKSAHFLETPDYIQVTGTGDLTKINIKSGDTGGELDPHGADALGNPHGGLVFSNVWNGSQGLGQQIHEWTNFMSSNQFCIRVCKPGPKAPQWCEHIYDLQGCDWNIPGDYTDSFTSCKSDSGIPMGIYPQPGGTTSTWHQEDGAVPSGHPAPAVTSCTTYQSAQLYAATATPIGPSATNSATQTGTGTGTRTALTDQTASSAALRSVNTGSGLLACLTALVGTALGSLVILA